MRSWLMRSIALTLRQTPKIAGLVAVAFLCATAPALAQETSGFNPQTWLKTSLDWIQGLGVGGGLVFIALYAVATVAFFPGSLLTLGAGVVYGVVQGSLYVLAGASLGAIAAFLLGRYLVRERVLRKMASNVRFKAVDAAIEREGLKVVLLTRLSPVFPFVLLNYALGVTGVSLRAYMLGLLGMIPGTVMYVYIGSLAGSLAAIGTNNQPTNLTVQWVIRIVGLLATVAVTLYVTRLARQALAEVAPEHIP